MAIQDVNPTQLILRTAQELKKESVVRPAPWAQFVKTGMHKERPPIKNDWWFARAASILRKIYALGPIGVSKLRTQYGGKKNRGYNIGKMGVKSQRTAHDRSQVAFSYSKLVNFFRGSL